MTTGITIKGLPLADEPIGDMLIPTGGFGDKTITIDQLRAYVQASYVPYDTTNPAIQVSNGKLQKLTLTANGKLTCDLTSGQYVFLKVRGLYTLDLTDFINITPHPIDTLIMRDLRFPNTMLIFNFMGKKFIFLTNYGESGKDNPDPVRVNGQSFIYSLDGITTKPNGQFVPREGNHVYINGIEFVESFPDTVKLEQLPILESDPSAPNGFSWVSKTKISNIGSVDLNFELIATPDNQDQTFTTLFGNQTIEVLSNNHFKFTLKADS